MLGTTDWLLKRFLKFVLKRNVGKYLSSELDLEQLDVKLDTGKLELKNLLLNCDALNKDLALDGWTVKAGYVGSVIAKLPLVSLSSSQCSVVINEVMLTVAPKPATATVGSGAPAPNCDGPAATFPQDIPFSSQGPPSPSPSSTGGAMGFLLADDFGWTGHSAVMDGIKRIAGSLQSMMQHMRVEASNVLVRMELPHPSEKGRVVTAALKLDLVELGDLSAAPPPSGSAAAQQQQPHHHDHRHHKASSTSTRPHAGVAGGADASSAGANGPVASAAAATGSGSSRREIAKLIQIKGLSLDLFETTPLLTGSAAAAATPSSSSSSPSAQSLTTAVPAVPAANNASGAGVTLVSGPGKHGLQLSVDLRMVMHDDPHQPTQIAADLHLGAVRLQLLPSHAVCLSALKAALDRQASSAGDTEPVAGTAGSSTEMWASYISGAASMHSAAGHWGRRSLFESIMLPNCEGVVAHSLEPYVTGAGRPYGDASEFHDACSRFGSLASSLVSSVSQTGTNLLGYVAASGTAAVGGAIEWMAPAPQSLQSQPSASRASEPQPLTSAASAPAALQAFAAAASTQPIIHIRAQVSHTAVVLCYGTSPAHTPQPQQQQHPTPRKGTHAPSSARSTVSGPGALHGGINGAAAAGGASTGNPAAAGGPGAGGSLVLELQDLSCDIWLDAAHGNGVALQAGQLQVYEQLPAAMSAKYGLSAAEWSRVPEVLPQAPHRFRPTQPSPTRTSLGGGASAGFSPRLGGRPTGRNSQAVSSGNGAASGNGNSLQTWPILSCASTPHSTGAAPYPTQATQGSAANAQGKAAGNKQTAQPAVVRGNVSSGGGAHGCLRMRAAWGGGAVPDCSGVGDGYDRYGSGTLPFAPSFDLSLELLPVTVWVSLPLVQRLTDFAAPLAAEASKPSRNGRLAKGAAVPKPAGPLPRLSLTVVAPHVCVLLALLPPSPPTASVPRPPGSPVFMALDIVSPPHPAGDSAGHAPAPSHASHTQQHHYHHHYHPTPYAAHVGPYGSNPHGAYGSYPGGQSYGAQQQQHLPYNGGWAGYASHQQGAMGYAQHHHGAPPAHQGHQGQQGPQAAWAAPPLLSIYQAPATDRLIPSQVTTIDLAAGVVELLLVRTAAGTSQPKEQAQTPGDGAPQQWAADSSGAALWTSKSLFSVSPSPAPTPPSSASPRPSWESPHSAPPTGPEDVPQGCGLHLHVCSDPGVGTGHELVAEAWGHVATHAQDRWADPDGEGGAWEERSSFRSVAFHERCRKSSANFVHLRTPNALMHLTRADMADLAALPSTLLPEPPAGAKPGPLSATAATSAKQRAAWGEPAAPGNRGDPGPQPQTCALLEVCLTIQLQDEPAVAVGNGHSVAAAAAAGAGGNHLGGASGGATAAGGMAQGLGLGLAGSRVSMYELAITELTVFRANSLGAQAGCNVTSVHAHGVTLMGHLEQHQLQAAAAAAAAAAAQRAAAAPGGAAAASQQHQPAAATARGGGGGGSDRHWHPPVVPGQGQQPLSSSGRGAQVPMTAAKPSHPHAGAQAVKGGGAVLGGAGHAICLLHCPKSSGAAEKAPAYIEYVCVEGHQPAPQPKRRSSAGGALRAMDAGWCESQPQGSGSSWCQRTSTSGALAGASSVGQGGGGFRDNAAAQPVETAVHSVLLQGMTFSTDHGYVTMDWAVQLGALFESVVPWGSAEAAPGRQQLGSQPLQPQSRPAAGGTQAAGVAQGGGHGSLSVNIVDLALRHEPMDYPTSAHGAPGMVLPGAANGGSAGHTQQHQRPNGAASSGAAASCGRVSPVALALIIEAVHFGLPLGQEELVPYTPPVHTVVLHSTTLHLAAADPRGPGWAAGDPRAIREPMLQACGYHRVLQETMIKVVVRQRRCPLRRPKAPTAPSDANLAAVEAAAAANILGAAEPQQQQEGAATFQGAAEEEEQPHTTTDVEVTNQHLLGVLTVESATLLAHFAMQAGTLMTARQAAAVAAAAAAAGAPWRRDSSRPGSCCPADLYWDAASENGSSAMGVGVGSGVGTCLSETGGDGAGSLLTALLLDEVEENAFRRVAPPQPTLGAAGSLAELGVLPSPSGGWYAQGSNDAGAVTAGAGGPGLILIDDFFPVNHQGEYDEDLTFVQHPPKDGRAQWRRDGAKMELEGTWYGPDDGPDRRAGGASAASGAGALAALGGLAQNGCRPAGPPSTSLPDYSGDPYDDNRPLGNGGDTEADMDSGCLFAGGMDLVSEDPDIDDLMMTDPLGNDPRVASASGMEAASGVAARVAPSVVSVASAGSSAATRSSSAPTWRLQEDYVRVPRKSDEDGSGPSGLGDACARGVAGGGAPTDADRGGGAQAGGGVDQPPPATRITFKDLSGIWVMHTTRSSAAGGAGGGAAGAAGSGGPQPTGAAAAAAAAAAAGGGSTSGLQEGRVELVVEGLGLVMESYRPGGHLARHIKLTVHDLEIRDCVLDVRQQQAAAAGALALGGGGGAAGRGGWVRVLGYRMVRGQPRDSRAPLVAVALTAVRPNPAACDPRDEEFRVAVGLLPLRLKLNQDIMSYLTWYGTSVSTALKPAAAVLAGMQAALSELDGCEPLPPPYFQRAQIRGFTIMLDYRPRRVDIAALAEGRMLELLNLVPLGGVELACKPLRLAGVQGWDGLGAAVLREWLNDIARTQAHKFIRGLAPVNAVVKVGSAVATLVSAPARHFARLDSAAGRQLAAQLRRTSATFAYRLVCEAMMAGRKAASGAGKALARVGSNALGAYGAYGGEGGFGGEGDESRDIEHDQESDDGDDSGFLYDGAEASGMGLGVGGFSGDGDEDGAGRMRRSRSTSVVVRRGLARAALSLGTASQQVAAGLQSGGLQRGVSNVARVLSAAAATGVSAAAPASAALQGQLKGTLRSMRRALRAQLTQGSGGGATGGSGGGGGGGGYPAQPHPKED